MKDNQEPNRVEFSMAPLYANDLLCAIEIACEKDPTFSGALKRFKVAIRASGYTEETLGQAAVEQMKERLGKEFTIIVDEDEEEEQEEDHYD